MSLMVKQKLTPKESDELIKNRVELNGPAILYGIAREKIRSLSASSVFPEIHIPTVSFHRQPMAKALSSKKPSTLPRRKNNLLFSNCNYFIITR